MKLTEIIVKRPVSALVIMLGIVLFGVTSLLGMPQELNPEMNMPMLFVMIPYPGASPEDVEKLVTREAEGAVGSLPGIDMIQTASMESVSLLMLQYEFGTDMDVAYMDCKDRLANIVNSLPEDTQNPMIAEMDALMGTDAISLSIAFDSQENMLGYVEEEIVPEFTRLTAVADVGVYGGEEEYIRVQLLEDMLSQYGVTMSTITQSLATADFSIPSGSAEYGNSSLPVRSSVEFDTIQALENIPIPLASGGVIRMADVAMIHSSVRDSESLSRYNGKTNISLGIQKRQSDTAVTVSRQVRAAVEDLNALNAGYHIDIVNDTSDTIQDALASVGQTLLLSIFLSMLVLFLFLGDIKASLIVGSSMPVSLLIAFTLMDFMGFTLNVVTMSSLVIGVGMMVDNSIVVIDSCFKSQTKEGTFIDAALAGAKFVMGSIVGSTVTTVVVFFPLATIQGLSGQLFTPLGFTIIFAMTASLISAMTLVPLFFTQFQPKERRNAPAAALLKKTELAYGRLLRRLLKRKKSVVAFSLVLVVISVFFGILLFQKMELMPSTDQGIVSISLETKPGLALREIDVVAAQLEAVVQAHPDVERFTMTAGGSGMNNMMSTVSATITAYLKDDRVMETNEVVEQWRKETAGFVNGKVSVDASSMNMSMGTANVLVDLKGNDLDTLEEFSRQVEDIMRAHPDMISVSSTFTLPVPQAEIVVDPMKAAAYGFTPMMVAQNVSMALSGAEATTFKQDDQEYSVRVEYPEGRYETISDMEDLMLVSPAGMSVPLSEISAVEFTGAPQTIVRIDNEYFAEITGVPTEEGRFRAQTDITAAVDALRFPRGIGYFQSDAMEMMTDEITALAMALLTANFLVFMVMAIQFESVKHSLMVMICIPFSMVGSFFFMFLMGATISMVSMLGFLILVGTVVNNGILFVDTANQYRRSMDVETALVQTGQHRLRPILMTTLTTILSMIPLLFATGSAEMMEGLAVAVIGGMTASTILTLLLLPTFYLIIDGNEQKKKRKAEKKREKHERRDREMQDDLAPEEAPLH